MALASCEGDSPASQSGDAAEPGLLSQGEAVTSLGAIEGPWAIARFRNFQPSWRTNIGWRAAYVHVRQDSLSYSIGCNHSGGRARIDRDGVLHKLGDSPSTLMGCDANSEINDHAFYGFFSSKPRVVRISEDRIILSSGGVELVLERPELRRRADPARAEDLHGRWVPQFLENFSGSGMSGFSMEEPRGVVTISRDELTWSGCAEADVQILYSSTYRLERRSAPKGTCSLGQQPGQDGATKLMRIMRSSPAVDRTGLHSIVLFTKAEAVHLHSEASVLRPTPPPPPPPVGGAAPVEPPPPPSAPES
jgi:hypothetical protein